MKYYLKALQNYTVFSGRSTRSEYWFFILFNFIFAIVAMIIDNIIGTTLKMDTINGAINIPYGYIYLLYALAVFLPSLALTVRRLHDVGKSGWFILIGLIPIVGAIWLLVLMVTDSDPRDNEYGPNPYSMPLETY
jgi:uncharacterized membrane protein YhaH (DUF805 family)